MQFKSLALSLLVAVATADDITQLVTQIPSCALTCLVTAAASVNCAITDYSCQCSNASALQASATPCVQSACSADDQASMLHDMLLLLYHK
jgi:hypothetical protein